MKIGLEVSTPPKIKNNCYVVGVSEKGKLSQSAQALDQATRGALVNVIKQAAFEGKIGQVLPIFNLKDDYAQILLIGCGDKPKVSPNDYRKIIIASAKALQSHAIKNAAIFLTDLAVNDFPVAWKVKQLAEVISEGFYRFDLFKSKKERPLALQKLTIVISDAKQLPNCQKALRLGETLADAVSFTKNIANLPSNICTPTFLAEQAKELTKEQKRLSVKVLNEDQMRKLDMGAILAVSQGSAEEAKLIVLQYQGADKKEAPIALVGKGVTFDTGGNSIKPADAMVGMKYDMCGAATVLGVMRAAASLALPINVVGVIAAVENMPGGSGYKPEDIIKTMSGKTIEVISTDAEGRVILSDALTYCEQFNPQAVVDIATLTGAVVVALGVHATGVVANDDGLAHELVKAGEEANDRAWQLPMWDDYQEQITSPFADMINSGGRSAGAITAGCFLSRFASRYKWAHLDVAGTAAIMAGVSERRATGRPVPLLLQFLIDRSR